MIKLYCDRCGKDITEEEHISVTIEYIGNGEPSPKAPDEYDICSECLKNLNNVLNKVSNEVENGREQ